MHWKVVISGGSGTGYTAPVTPSTVINITEASVPIRNKTRLHSNMSWSASQALGIREKESRSFKNFKLKFMKNSFKNVIMLLKEAFNYNLLAHNYGSRSKEYFHKKTVFMREAIAEIKAKKLPIKHGVKEGIYYFEFLGDQVSFHMNYGGNSKKTKSQWKTFHGDWKWEKNLKFPEKWEKYNFS